MPTVADANIPYMELAEFYPWDEKRATFKMELNGDFARRVGQRLAQKGQRG